MKNIILTIGMVLFIASSVYGLGQRLAVKYIRAIAANAELTPAQVDSLTKRQAATYILNNYPNIPAAKLKEASTYWPGIKIMIHNDAVEREFVERFALWITQLRSDYPDAVGLDTEYAEEIGRQLIPLLYGEVDTNAL